MFYIKYLCKNIAIAFRLLLRGEWVRVFNALYARVCLGVSYALFFVQAPFLRSKAPPIDEVGVSIETEHAVAFTSPDHIMPFGTRYNNSTNRKFVTLLNRHVRERFHVPHPGFMDLGCSGGQLVADFADLRWLAVGLEGSDYSLKHRRANWAQLANKNLFTCDITKPFRVKRQGGDFQFHLITSWEVLEHIKTDDLTALFNNIRSHLVTGGLFIASTNSESSVVDGVELHQTRMNNAEWKAFVAARFPDLEPVDLGLKVHQYVRFDYGEPSFLVYRKK